jgi:hypothetical protein
VDRAQGSKWHGYVPYNPYNTKVPKHDCRRPAVLWHDRNAAVRRIYVGFRHMRNYARRLLQVFQYLEKMIRPVNF